MNYFHPKHLFILLINVILLGSCTSVKNIAYLQNLNTNSGLNQATQTAQVFEAHIKAKDLLSITVVATNPEASKSYNLIMPQVSELLSSNSLTSQPALQSYLVDNEGYIDFPVFGKIHVVGKTRKELTDFLLEKLAPSFTKELPIITIRFLNYSVNILGEVGSPGIYTTKNDRITILEGIAQAGDLTIYGKRDNVKILRENYDGSKTVFTLNLNDNKIVNSPAYFLEQNDVVYIEPNKAKSSSSKFGSAESFGLSAVSILFTLTNLVISILR